MTPKQKRVEQLMLADAAVQIGRGAKALDEAADKVSNRTVKAALRSMADEAWGVYERAVFLCS